MDIEIDFLPDTQTHIKDARQSWQDAVNQVALQYQAYRDVVVKNYWLQPGNVFEHISGVGIQARVVQVFTLLDPYAPDGIDVVVEFVRDGETQSETIGHLKRHLWKVISR